MKAGRPGRRTLDWDAISGVAGAILWMLFLALKKRKRDQKRRAQFEPEATAEVQVSTESDSRPQEFERGYEPIEPR